MSQQDTQQRFLIEERGRIAVDCEFCDRHYTFDAIDVEQVFASVAQTHTPGMQQ